MGVKLEAEEHAAVVEIAEQHELSHSEVGRNLIRQALEAGGAELIERKLSDEGYNDGLRRGLREARMKIQGAVKGDWK